MTLSYYVMESCNRVIREKEGKTKRRKKPPKKREVGRIFQVL